MSKFARKALWSLSFLPTILIGYWMYQRSSMDALWGHLPLWLFLSFWVAFVVIFWYPWGEERRASQRRFGLATATGLLLALGFPPLPTGPVLLVAFLPLLWAEYELRQAGKEAPKRELFRLSYHAFILWNILSTFWVANSALAAGIFAVVVNAFLMCLPVLLFHWTAKAMPRLAYMPLVVYWLSLEQIHLRWDLNWPWLNLGNGFASLPQLAQWYEFTGVLGGTLWVLLANTLLLQWIIRYHRQEKTRFGAILNTVLVLFVPLIVSLVLYYRFDLAEESKAVEVVVLQPNYEPHYEQDTAPLKEQLDRVIGLALSNVDENTDYLVFPETTFGSIQKRRLGEEQVTARLSGLLDTFPGLTIVGGLSVYRVLEPGEAPTPATRTLERPNREPLYYEAYNAAIQLEKGQSEIPFYKKSKLVPGAEFFPFRRYLSFLQPILEQFGGSVAGLGKQEERSVFTSSDGYSVAPIICYESVFGEYHAGYVRAGAQFGFIMTNDGWWDATAGHIQHLQYASLRAIETRRAIARAANTGISGFINARGDIVARSSYGETTALRGAVQARNERTFYVKWGDYLGRLALFTAALFLLNAFVKGRMGSD